MKARARARAAGLKMSASGKEQALVDFYDELDREGLTVSFLAELAHVGRSHLEQVFNGQRAGRNTWKHVIPMLGNKSLFLLKQCSAWNTHADAALANMPQARRDAFAYFSP